MWTLRFTGTQFEREVDLAQTPHLRGEVTETQRRYLSPDGKPELPIAVPLSPAMSLWLDMDRIRISSSPLSLSYHVILFVHKPARTHPKRIPSPCGSLILDWRVMCALIPRN